MKNKVVYISHPYHGQQNVMEKVNKICRDAIAGGVTPLSPIHLFSYTDDTYRDQVMSMCLRLVQMADELWLYGDSAGCMEEVQAAKKLDIPIIVKGGVLLG